MSRLENIDNAIWSDPDFEELSGPATLLYLWSFTNPRCGMAGLYRVSYRAMGESKVPVRDMDGVVDELAQGRFAHYVDGVLWVRSRVKHIYQRTPMMARSIAKDVRKTPEDHPLREAFLSHYGDEKWLEEELAPLKPQPPVDGSGFGSVSHFPNSSRVAPEYVQGQGQGQGSVVPTTPVVLHPRFTTERLSSSAKVGNGVRRVG